jgi:hypothetical protein
MNCGDFERAWNERLDARDAAPPEIARAIAAHAAECPACQVVASRYQTLERALRMWGPGPSVPADLADRVLASPVLADVPTPRLLRLHPGFAALAAAASVLVALLLGLRSGGVDPRRETPLARPEPPRVVRAIDPHALSEALASATSATLDLARETSAPAARIGREVIASAEVSLSESGPKLPITVDVEPASGVLQSVGDRVNAGVRPLSGTARHAFGFLLGSAVGG